MKKIRKILIIILITIGILLSFNLKVNAKTANVYMFYGKTCPHCEAALEYLDSIKDKYDFKVYKYEVWEDKDNQKLMNKIGKYLKVEAKGVPFTIIDNTPISGFGEGVTEDAYKYHIKAANKDSFVDKVGIKLGVVKEENVKTTTNKTNKKNTDFKIKVPFVGKVNLKYLSLPVVSILIGLVDGFNPCAMWILLFLISTLIGMKDKKRLWVLGITFLVSSALVYLAFMVSWLSFANFISGLTIVRVIIALVAVIGGCLNLNSYAKSLKEDDGCDVVDEKKRKKIFKRIRKFTHEKSFVIALLGIILLAASVNIIELACSAGLPVIFTQVLAMNNLSKGMYALYIFLYILFFMLDDLIVFTVAVKTMELTGISTKYSKYSHLIGGIIMLLIGILLVVKPEWLMFNF